MFLTVQLIVAVHPVIFSMPVLARYSLRALGIVYRDVTGGGCFLSPKTLHFSFQAFAFCELFQRLLLDSTAYWNGHINKQHFFSTTFYFWHVLV